MADLVILDLNWVRSISYCRATDIIIVYYIVYSGALFPSGRFTWSAQINCLFFADTSQQIQTFQLEPRFGRPYPILIDSYLREVYQAAGDFGLWNLRIWPIWYLMGVAGMVLSFYNSFIRIACTASIACTIPLQLIINHHWNDVFFTAWPMIDQILIDRRAKSKRPSTRAPWLCSGVCAGLSHWLEAKGLEVHVSQLKTMPGKS